MRDLARAVRGARKAGLEPDEVSIGPDGTIRLKRGKPQDGEASDASAVALDRIAKMK
jgi:hypothetical protein